MVSVLTLSGRSWVGDRSWASIIVSVLTLSVIDRGLESQYNGKCAHLEW